jgi:hypothetical protein
VKGIAGATIAKLRWLREQHAATHEEWFDRHGTKGNRLPSLLFTYKLVESAQGCPLPRREDDEHETATYFRLTEAGRELLKEVDGY